MKARCWIDDVGEYVDIIELVFKDNEVIGAILDAENEETVEYIDGYPRTETTSYWKADDFTLELYTGLKDKKRTKEFPDGQPIYEGDIVSRQQQPDWPKTEYFLEIEKSGLANAQVIWKDEAYGFRLTCCGCSERKCIHDWFLDTYVLKVIGNIHENKNLLE